MHKDLLSNIGASIKSEYNPYMVSVENYRDGGEITMADELFSDVPQHNRRNTILAFLNLAVPGFSDVKSYFFLMSEGEYRKAYSNPSYVGI